MNSTKPEIGYDREAECFTLDGQPITDTQARERWDAVDSEWSCGAYREMCERVMT